MKMSKMAIMQMMDAYEDRIVVLYDETENIWEFPMKMVKEAKTIWEEIAWMEEGGWVSSEEAQSIWNHVEKAAERFQEKWEKDMKED